MTVDVMNNNTDLGSTNTDMTSAEDVGVNAVVVVAASLPPEVYHTEVVSSTSAPMTVYGETNDGDYR